MNLERKKRFKTSLAVNSASLQLFSSCQNEYPNSAGLATPLMNDSSATNEDLGEASD